MIRDFFIYGVGGAASRLAAIFLVPLYTRTLGVEEYGQLELLLAIYLLAVLLAGLQSESAILRDFYVAREKGRLPKLRWAGLFITFAGTVLLGLFAAGIAALGWIDLQFIQYLPLLILLTLLAQLFGIQLILMRFAGKPVRFALLSFLDVALAAAVSVGLMVGLKWGIWGALLGITSSKVVVVAVAWQFSFGRFPRFWPSRRLYKRMLSYSIPTMPSVLLNWLQTSGTRVLLAVFLVISDVAIASVAIRVSALFGFVVYSFRLAWEPWAFRQLDRHDREANAFNHLLVGFIVGMFLLAGLATLAGPVLVRIFAPPAYSAATALVGCFVIGQLWIGIANITAIGIHGARVTSRLTIISSVGAGLNVGVLALLSGLIGVTAAAVAFLASCIASAFTATWLSERHFSTGFSWRLLWWTAFASVSFATASWLFQAPQIYGGLDLSTWQSAAGLATVLVGLLGLLAFAGVTSQERASLAALAFEAIRPIRGRNER